MEIEVGISADVDPFADRHGEWLTLLDRAARLLTLLLLDPNLGASTKSTSLRTSYILGGVDNHALIGYYETRYSRNAIEGR